jgi:hypothetical protein
MMQTLSNATPAGEEQRDPGLTTAAGAPPATGERLAALRAYLRANPALPPRAPIAVPARVLGLARAREAAVLPAEVAA